MKAVQFAEVTCSLAVAAACVVDIGHNLLLEGQRVLPLVSGLLRHDGVPISEELSARRIGITG